MKTPFNVDFFFQTEKETVKDWFGKSFMFGVLVLVAVWRRTSVMC